MTSEKLSAGLLIYYSVITMLQARKGKLLNYFFLVLHDLRFTKHL